MGNPLVSVITIAFNAERYIEATIKSVLEQNYSSIEYIVIDGDSKDDTLKVVGKYQNEIEKIVSEPDDGIYDAMNKGLSVSTGDFVIFMNSGDRFASKTTLSDAIKEGENADFIYGDTLRVSEDGIANPWHKITPNAKALNARSFLDGMVICHQSMVVRRSFAPYYEDKKWKISADIDWAIRILRQQPTIFYTGEAFCHYLEGGVSITGKWEAVKERFYISMNHFGLMSTLLTQMRLIFQYLFK